MTQPIDEREIRLAIPSKGCFAKKHRRIFGQLRY